MTEQDPDTSDPRQVANFTVAYLRRLDQKVNKMMEILLRHETRLGRVERDIGEVKRDIGEVKSDIVLLENRVLTQANEILSAIERLDEHQQRLEKVRFSPERIG